MDPSTVPFQVDAIFIPLFIIVQSALLAHSLSIEWSRHFQTKVLFIILQLLALYWTVMDLIRYIIDPLYPFLPHTLGCPFLASSVRVIPGLFYFGL